MIIHQSEMFNSLHSLIISGSRFIFADISKNATYPTVIHLKTHSIRTTIVFYSIGAVLTSPINNPTHITYKLHKEQSIESKNNIVSFYKNGTTYTTNIIPLAKLTEGMRGNICGVVVKVSPVRVLSEDKLYQVYLIDESLQQPLRVSVYLHNEDTQPYFQVRSIFHCSLVLWNMCDYDKPFLLCI